MVDTAVLGYEEDLAVEMAPGRVAREGTIHRRRRLVLAGLLALAGFVAMAAGWIGVSSTRVVSEQLSYLASGGVFGVGLIGAAAALLVADFMLVQEQALEEIRASVADGRARPSGWGVAGLGSGRGTELVTVAGGSRVHLSSCQLVRGKDGVQPAEAEAVRTAGLRACRVCRPPLDAGGDA